MSPSLQQSIIPPFPNAQPLRARFLKQMRRERFPQEKPGKGFQEKPRKGF